MCMLPAFRHATFGRMQACYPQATCQACYPKAHADDMLRVVAYDVLKLGSLFLRRCSHTSLVEFQKLKRPSTSPFVAAGYRRMAEHMADDKDPKKKTPDKKDGGSRSHSRGRSQSARSRATIAETKGPGAAASVVVMTEATTTVAVAGTNVMVVDRGQRPRSGSHGGGGDHHRGGDAGDHHHRGGGAGGDHPDKDGGVYCSICWAWIRSRHHLKQHQETSARCRSFQGHGPAKISCKVCGKRVTAQRWAVEQHSWKHCATGDVEMVLGDQQVEEAASSSNPKTWPDRGNSRVRLQSVMVVRRTSTAARATTRHQSLMCHQRM